MLNTIINPSVTIEVGKKVNEKKKFYYGRSLVFALNASTRLGQLKLRLVLLKYPQHQLQLGLITLSSQDIIGPFHLNRGRRSRREMPVMTWDL